MLKIEFGIGDKTIKWEIWIPWTIKIFDARIKKKDLLFEISTTFLMFSNPTLGPAQTKKI